MCVSQRDVNRLFPLALTAALRNLEVDGSINLVSPDPKGLRQAMRGIDCEGRRLRILPDAAVLRPGEVALCGWLRQQVIKLRADEFCSGNHIWCLSADAIVVRPIKQLDVTDTGRPVIFYNRYPFASNHLHYERRRVAAVAELLQVEPRISYLLGDFIVDLALLDREHLAGIRNWLYHRHGCVDFSELLPSSVTTLEEKTMFGEWTLYAVFVLDALQAPVSVRNSASRFASQIHSRHDLMDDALFKAAVIHFVPKNVPIEEFYVELTRRSLPRYCQ